MQELPLVAEDLPGRDLLVNGILKGLQSWCLIREIDTYWKLISCESVWRFNRIFR